MFNYKKKDIKEFQVIKAIKSNLISKNYFAIYVILYFIVNYYLKCLASNKINFVVGATKAQ